MTLQQVVIEFSAADIVKQKKKKSAITLSVFSLVCFICATVYIYCSAHVAKTCLLLFGQ